MKQELDNLIDQYEQKKKTMLELLPISPDANTELRRKTKLYSYNTFLADLSRLKATTTPLHQYESKL